MVPLACSAEAEIIHRTSRTLDQSWIDMHSKRRRRAFLAHSEMAFLSQHHDPFDWGLFRFSILLDKRILSPSMLLCCGNLTLFHPLKTTSLIVSWTKFAEEAKMRRTHFKSLNPIWVKILTQILIHRAISGKMRACMKNPSEFKTGQSCRDYTSLFMMIWSWHSSVPSKWCQWLPDLL